jgi:hypothetical protein
MKQTSRHVKCNFSNIADLYNRRRSGEGMILKFHWIRVRMRDRSSGGESSTHEPHESGEKRFNGPLFGVAVHCIDAVYHGEKENC